MRRVRAAANVPLLVALSLSGCGRVNFDEGASPCARLPVGTACDDGYACTDDDRCTGGGECTGVPNDANCADTPASICVPSCFAAPSGCGLPPSSLDVSCAAGPDGEASCSVAATGGLGVTAGCLACEATVGFVPLIESDFEDTAGMCSPDGWQLASGNVCVDGAAGCSTTGAAIACCGDFNGICSSSFLGAGLLQSVFEENCGGGLKQFRAERVVDASSVTDLRLCFDASEAYGVAGDAVLAEVRDGTTAARLDCVQGDTDWRGAFQTRCTDLPAWTSNNPALTVTLVGHNDAAHGAYPTEVKRMALDNVSLYGREPACSTQSRVTVFDETFTGATDPIAEGFHGWSITEGVPRSSNAACAGAGQGAVAEGAEWSLARHIDTSTLSGGVELCLLVGHVAAIDVTERISVRIDTGNGAGWRRAGRGSLYRAAANQCQEICFNLSAASPAAAHNPDLQLEISATSTAVGIKTLIDDVRVSGVQSCDGDAFVSVGPLSDVGGDAFELTVSNERAQPLTAQLTCTWSLGAHRNIASAPVRLE
jgi:hypothetical protein